MSMTPEVKALWTAALRSGEYEQSQGGLRDRHGFCCLGVLCDLKSKEDGGAGWEEFLLASSLPGDTTGIAYSFNGEPSFAPGSVLSWAGIIGEADEAIMSFRLVGLNDRGTPFTEIADYIDKEL
jgi:hypothetical protein